MADRKIVEVPPRRGKIKAKMFGVMARKVASVVGLGRKIGGGSGGGGGGGSGGGGGGSGSSASTTPPLSSYTSEGNSES
ncbi:hypothetical protein ACSBR1_007532 [Camellia fascicularis]